MTGLDQDMMQKNLTCKDLRSAQKNMCIYGFGFIPLNLLLLSLGVLASTYIGNDSIKGDSLLFEFVLNTSDVAKIFFSIGILSSALSSIDSSIVSLTTSLSEDIFYNKIKLKNLKFLVIFLIFISSLIFFYVTNKSAIELIYSLVSYLYGPLLGLFFFGIFTKRKIEKEYVFPILAILSPLISFILDYCINKYFGYKLGYVVLILNGLIMFLTLFCISKTNNFCTFVIKKKMD